MDNTRISRDRSSGESLVSSGHFGHFGMSKPFMTTGEFQFLLPHFVPISAVEETENFLRHSALRDCEGAVLWIAESGSESFRVHRVIAPRQTASRWHFDVSLEERIRIAMTLKEEELVLLQVHSHPEEAFHSPTDDRKAMIDRQWALSIVVPNFCSDGMRDLHKLAAYALRGPLDWVQLSTDQLQRLLVIQ